MHRFVLHNDDICDASAKVLSPGQVGLLSGWGVFSTMRIVGGVPFAFERHWQRMKRDAEVLRVPFPEDADSVRAAVLRLIEANQFPDATLRLVVVRNRGGLWEGPNGRDYDVIALTTGVKEWGESVKLALHEHGRDGSSRFRGVKMLSWALNLVMAEEAHCRGFDEVLLLNEHGEVSECSSANVFAARNGEVLTPPLESGCLPGVTRDILLHTIRAGDITIREHTLRLEDLKQADEVFITSTTRNLLPVDSIEGRPLRRNGDLRARLENAFEDYVTAYVSQHR